MMDAQLTDYRHFGLESSNLLMEWDGLWVLGRYEEAAHAVFKAGDLRRRMGRLRFEAGDFEEAIEDWLSAMDCFLQAAAPKYAREILTLLKDVEAAGGFPASRPDLIAVLGERVSGLRQLEDKVRTFLQTFDKQGIREDHPDPHALEFLIDWVRELPGYALLHYMIFRQYDVLGNTEGASNHLYWAARFDLDDARYISIMIHKFVEYGQHDVAWKIGDAFLANHPESIDIRIALATALTSRSKPGGPDYRRAIEMLEPVVSQAGNDFKRFIALGFSALFRRELGHVEQFVDLLQRMDDLRKFLTDSNDETMADAFRQHIPVMAEPKSDTATSADSHRSADELARHWLSENAKLLTIPCT